MLGAYPITGLSLVLLQRPSPFKVGYLTYWHHQVARIVGLVLHSTVIWRHSRWHVKTEILLKNQWRAWLMKDFVWKTPSLLNWMLVHRRAISWSDCFTSELARPRQVSCLSLFTWFDLSLSAESENAAAVKLARSLPTKIVFFKTCSKARPFQC